MKMSLEQLKELGFDRSSSAFGRDNLMVVVCSQCQAMVINGHPTHERGCPNQTHECEECGALIKRGLRLCESCANPEPIKEDEE